MKVLFVKYLYANYIYRSSLTSKIESFSVGCIRQADWPLPNKICGFLHFANYIVLTIETMEINSKLELRSHAIEF